jgi:hypothetical protein
MSRRVIFLLLLLTALPAPLRAAKNIAVPPAPAPAVSGTVPIDDLEPPIEPPLSLAEQIRESVWLRASLAAALAAVIILLIILSRKKQPAPQVALSPAEEAERALAQAEQLIAAGDCAAFAEIFDQTLRRYLEGGLGLAALRQTASELISRIDNENGGLPDTLGSYSNDLENWLRCCEAGKFAGAALSQEEMTEMTTQLRSFIKAAKMLAQRDGHGQLPLR